MVKVPYVNHVATLTGGVGYEDLARFYKYHFTTETVTVCVAYGKLSRADRIGSHRTPSSSPCLALVSERRRSRISLMYFIVGADRIIDEMIFKCTHTTVSFRRHNASEVED